MKLSGIEIEELEVVRKELNKQTKCEISKNKQRKKYIINRVKLLIPYQDILVRGALVDDNCPRCGSKKIIESAWGRSSVFEYYHCSKCEWEYGYKYPREEGTSLVQ